MSLTQNLLTLNKKKKKRSRSAPRKDPKNKRRNRRRVSKRRLPARRHLLVLATKKSLKFPTSSLASTRWVVSKNLFRIPKTLTRKN